MSNSMYHLRRINFQSYVSCKMEKSSAATGGKGAGKAATANEVEAINDKIEPSKNPSLRSKSTFILLDKVTKIGRNPELVDVVLNSVMHSNMISRDHSEILGELDENHGYKYFICDKSLNGTYVNDTRVTGAVPLHDGDIIKFGHVNGAAIRAGEYAPQQTAEFIFRFERAIPGHSYFGYTEKGVRIHPEKARAYMQIYSDRVAPQEAFPASATKVLPQASIAAANATVPAAVSLPASTNSISTVAVSTANTSSTNNTVQGLAQPIAVPPTQPNSIQGQLHSSSLTMPQHAAAAAAVAAAANLSPDDVAAVSAHLRTVAAADAFNSWNSSLYQLTRLQQQNPHLYGTAFPAAAAAAAAYFQSGTPALWPNVAQWRAALQPPNNAPTGPVDWAQFNQQKAAVAAYAAANSASTAATLQQHLRLPAYSQSLSNSACLPAPLPLPVSAPSSGASNPLLPQILSPHQLGNGGLASTSSQLITTNSLSYYGLPSHSAGSGVISSANASSLCTMPSNSSAYSSCTSVAGNRPTPQESPLMVAKLAAAAAAKEELDAATRAAAAWPAAISSSSSTSSASSIRTQPQLPPGLASVLPAALARQAGVPLSYMANTSALSIGQRIPIATALAAVSGSMNGGVNQQAGKVPNGDWRSAAINNAIAEDRRLGSPTAAGSSLNSSNASNMGTPPPLNNNNSTAAAKLTSAPGTRLPHSPPPSPPIRWAAARPRSPL